MLPLNIYGPRILKIVFILLSAPTKGSHADLCIMTFQDFPASLQKVNNVLHHKGKIHKAYIEHYSYVSLPKLDTNTCCANRVGRLLAIIHWQTQSDSILELDDSSNVCVPGKYVFRVDGKKYSLEDV